MTTQADVLEKHAQKLAPRLHDKLKRPARYEVIMLNDDFTPMDFVVEILCTIFQKDQEEAVSIMLTIHKAGYAVCGVFSLELAEAKVVQTIDLARQAEFPLHCVMRQVEGE